MHKNFHMNKEIELKSDVDYRFSLSTRNIGNHSPLVGLSITTIRCEREECGLIPKVRFIKLTDTIMTEELLGHLMFDLLLSMEEKNEEE